MKRLLASLGLLFLLGACSYAQNAASGTVSDSNSSRVATTATPDQDQTAGPSSSKDKDTDKESSSGHHIHIRLGGITVSGGYTHFSPGFYPNDFPYGPFYYPFAAAGWWDPFWGACPPFPAGYFSQGNAKGALKLSGAPKNASVYVNGGYAGTADHLKSFWLDPGAYDLEVSVPGGRRYEQRVYVLTGKTLHIDAKPMLAGKEGEQL